MKKSILVLLISIYPAIVLAGNLQNPSGRYLPDGTFQSKNLHAFLPDPSSDEPYWPIAASWGNEVYVSDSTESLLDPCLVVGDSLLHVFATRYQNGADSIGHFRSTDGGNSWNYYACYQETIPNCGPAIPRAFYEGNRIYTVWPDGRPLPANQAIHFRSSTNNGQTWTISSYLRYEPSDDYARYPDITGHKDTAFVSFNQDHYLNCWRSTNRGQSWTHPNHVADCYGTFCVPSIIYSGGIVNIAYQKYIEGQHESIYFVRSLDHGTTWQEPVYLELEGGQGETPQLSADSLGNCAVVWMDYLGSPYGWTGGIWCRVSHDSGGTWQEAVRLDNDYLGDILPTVAIDGNYIGVVWAAVTSPWKTLHFRESWDGGISWSEDQVLTSRSVYGPRLMKRGNRLHLIWLKDEIITPPYYTPFCKYMRCDDLNSVEDDNESEMPGGISIKAYPNPFNSAVILTYNDLKGGESEIRIFDLGGRLIRTLRTEGGKATWDATDNTGQKVCSGLYFARVKDNNRIQSLKLILLK